MANTVKEDLSAPGMTDVRRARLLLERDGHTCVLCRGDKVYADDRAGIAPMMGFIGAGVDLRGFSAADRIVGHDADRAHNKPHRHRYLPDGAGRYRHRRPARGI